MEYEDLKAYVHMILHTSGAGHGVVSKAIVRSKLKFYGPVDNRRVGRAVRACGWIADGDEYRLMTEDEQRTTRASTEPRKSNRIASASWWCVRAAPTADLERVRGMIEKELRRRG